MSGVSKPVDPSDPLIGQVINDRFRVISMIARGGMGRVYRAEQMPLGRIVAIKVLMRQSDDDPDPGFQRRFFLEASVCAKLKHPNTVTIFDYGQTETNTYYIAMEHLEGRTLRKAMKEDGPFAPGRAIHIAVQICRSVREAHGLGVIHRDLKPGNVILVKNDDDADFVKVLDFGLVKPMAGTEDLNLTRTGLFMGSPKYMPPEQIRGKKVAATADVYALGVVLYEMLTGKAPFARKTSMDILMAHLQEPVPEMRERNPEVQVPPALELITLKCLEKAPQDRFSSMDDLMKALRNAALDDDVSLPPGTGSTTSSQALPLQISKAVPPPVPEMPEEISLSDIDTGPQEGESNTLRWIAATLGGILVVGLAVIFIGPALEGSGDEPSGATVNDPVTPADPVVANDPPGTDVALPVKVEPVLSLALQLRSNPSGARVKVGENTVCEETPCDLEWTGEQARRGQDVEFLFLRKGHRNARVTRSLNGDTVTVSVTLQPRRRPTKRPHKSPKNKGPDENVDGYKDNPY